MSLYNLTEICKNCLHSHFHSCEICGRESFCYCDENKEDSVNNYNGTCPFKEVDNERK